MPDSSGHFFELLGNLFPVDANGLASPEFRCLIEKPGGEVFLAVGLISKNPYRSRRTPSFGVWLGHGPDDNFTESKRRGTNLLSCGGGVPREDAAVVRWNPKSAIA